MLFQGVELTAYTSRCINPLDELCITYNLAVSKESSPGTNNARHLYFTREWGFTCQCVKCSSNERLEDWHKEEAAQMSTLDLEQSIQAHGHQRWTQQYGAWVDEYLHKIMQNGYY